MRKNARNNGKFLLLQLPIHAKTRAKNNVTIFPSRIFILKVSTTTQIWSKVTNFVYEVILS